MQQSVGVAELSRQANLSHGALTKWNNLSLPDAVEAGIFPIESHAPVIGSHMARPMPLRPYNRGPVREGRVEKPRSVSSASSIVKDDAMHALDRSTVQANAKDAVASAAMRSEAVSKSHWSMQELRQDHQVKAILDAQRKRHSEIQVQNNVNTRGRMLFEMFR